MSDHEPNTADGAPGGQYRVDPARSTAGFKAKGGWGLFTVSGRFASFAGTIEVDGQRLAARGTAEAVSITTDLGPRDTHLRSRDYLAAKKHPEITLTIEDAAIADGRAQAQVTVRGARATAELELEVVDHGVEQIHLRARGELDRSPFGMRTPLLGVGRIVTLDLDVTGTRA